MPRHSKLPSGSGKTPGRNRDQEPQGNGRVTLVRKNGYNVTVKVHPGDTLWVEGFVRTHFLGEGAALPTDKEIQDYRTTSEEV